MPRKELFERYVLFFISVVFQGIAIALITYADIGTTPISSANYVLSLHSDFTLGDTTLIFNLMLLLLQLTLIFIGDYKLKDHAINMLMQIPTCLVFSVMIDISTNVLTLVLSEHNYVLSWVLVVLGTVLLALAVSMSVIASVCMIPGEYFIKLFHPLVKKSFSFVKTFFDIFLVSSAVIISLFLTGFTEIEGVREGTLFAALTTGPIVHIFIPRLKDRLTKLISA
ncbi:MAG: YitT family protein [Succinivibrio sp.]